MKRSPFDNYSESNKTSKSSDFDIDSFDREDNKHSKRQTKLQKFLKTIDEQFQEQMRRYLQAQRENFQKGKLLPKVPKITLYEDILFIFYFKIEEENLSYQSKKQTVDKLLNQLKAITRRQKVTIKERIQKKLSGLTVQQLKKNIRRGWDITFDKKNINSKKLEPENHSPNMSLQKYLESKKKSAIFEIVQVDGDQEETIQTEKERNKKSIKTTLHQKNALPNNEHFLHNSSQYFDNNVHGLYRYGSHIIRRKIYVGYNKASNAFVVFDKSSFNKFAIQTQQKIDQSNRSTVDKRQKRKKQLGQKIEIEQKHRSQQNSSHKHKESYQNIFQEYEMLLLNADPSQKQIQDKKQKIIAAIRVRSFQYKTQSNLQQIRKLETMLSSINRLQDNIRLQKEKNLEQWRSIQYDENKSNNKPQYVAQDKSDCPDFRSSKRAIASKQKVVQRKSVYSKQQQLYNLNNNLLYLELIQEDPTKEQNYLWSRQEDKIIREYKRNPYSGQSAMMCLLRYKSWHYVLERYEFLSIDINSNLMDMLRRLQGLACENWPKSTRESKNKRKNDFDII